MPGAHPFGDEGLEQILLGGVMGDFLGNPGRDHHHTFAVADADIAREHRHTAAADRHVEVDGVVLDQIGWRRATLTIGREREFRDLR